MSARLQDLRQALHQMNRELNSVQKSGDIAMGRNRNVVIHGILRPFIKDGEKRGRDVKYHIGNLLRRVEIPKYVADKRVLRLGRWQAVRDSGCRDPRPTMLEFAN